MGVAFGSVLGLSLFLASSSLPQLFSDDARVVAMAQSVIPVVAVALVPPPPPCTARKSNPPPLALALADRLPPPPPPGVSALVAKQIADRRQQCVIILPSGCKGGGFLDICTSQLGNDTNGEAFVHTMASVKAKYRCDSSAIRPCHADVCRICSRLRRGRPLWKVPCLDPSRWCGWVCEPWWGQGWP